MSTWLIQSIKQQVWTPINRHKISIKTIIFQIMLYLKIFYPHNLLITRLKDVVCNSAAIIVVQIIGQIKLNELVL